jgi:uncharacterized alpha-E superfamily protein
MLGRTASSLFWMSRYMERAEHIARLISVGYRESLTPDIGAGYRGDWTSTLVAAGCDGGFLTRHDKVTAETVQAYLLLDRSNPSSVRSCIESARNNARSVRTALTREMWEALNGTYNEFGAIGMSDLGPGRLPEVLDWVRERANLFRGAMLGTLLRDEGYCFSQLGTFVERGDNTARSVDVKYSVLLPTNEVAGGERNVHHWETVLRSVAAHRSYRYFFKDAYRAPEIVEFLILRPEMPRSLRFCSDWTTSMLMRLADLMGGGGASLEAATALHALLESTTTEAIFRTGLHEFLLDFIGRNAALGATAANEFNFG